MAGSRKRNLHNSRLHKRFFHLDKILHIFLEQGRTMMNVAELIERLRTFPPDLPVLVEGYESGWDSIQNLRQDKIVQFDQAREWDGEYCEGREAQQTGTTAVLIVGRRGAFREDTLIEQDDTLKSLKKIWGQSP
jgi:hypothetical protein